MFTATEIAEFEYCPLAWWYDRFEPMAQADDETVFARMVELEHQHGARATGLPEYQMMEQLLLRRGAFETGKKQHQEYGEAVNTIADTDEKQTTLPILQKWVLAGAFLFILGIILLLLAVTVQ